MGIRYQLSVISYRLSAISYQVNGSGMRGDEMVRSRQDLQRKIGDRCFKEFVMGDYRKLRAWRKAHELAVSVYRATESFPSTEKYGLVSQMRRAAVSAASNIVEGVGRNRSTETAHFIRIALGSCTELEYQVLLSQELKFLDLDLALTLTEGTKELRAMLASLHRHLQTPANPPRSDSG